MKKCDDCIIGQHLQRPSLVGVLVEESKRHLYFIHHDEYVVFNFCPCCGHEIKGFINNKRKVET